MKRKRLPPDTRPDWRNEKMLVIRDYRMADGSRMTMIDPDYERRYREHLIQTTTHASWRDDPTYNLRKDRRK